MAEESKSGSTSEIYVTAVVGETPIRYRIDAKSGTIFLEDGKSFVEAFPDPSFALGASDAIALAVKYHNAVLEAEQERSGREISKLSAEKDDLEKRVRRLEESVITEVRAEPASGEGASGNGKPDYVSTFPSEVPARVAPGADKLPGPEEKTYTINVSYAGGRWPAEIKNLKPDATLASVLAAYKEVNKENFPVGIQYAKIRIPGLEVFKPDTTIKELADKFNLSITEFQVYVPSLDERASDVFGKRVWVIATKGKAKEVLDAQENVLGAELGGEFYICLGDQPEFYVNAVTKELVPTSLVADLNLVFDKPVQAKGETKVIGEEEKEVWEKEAWEADRKKSGLEEVVKNSFDPRTKIATYDLPDGRTVRYTLTWAGGIRLLGGIDPDIIMPYVEQLKDFWQSSRNAKHGSPLIRPHLVRPAPPQPPIVFPPAAPPPPHQPPSYDLPSPHEPLPPLPPLPPAEPAPPVPPGADKEAGEEAICPSCGSAVSRTDPRCVNCGRRMVRAAAPPLPPRPARDEEAVAAPDEEDAEGPAAPAPLAASEENGSKEPEEFECPRCGSAVSSTAAKCAKCGVEFESFEP